MSMIVEARTYKTKPGQRDPFLDFFEHEAVPLQRSLGIRVSGPFIDTENPDVFVWLRSFPSPDERDRMKAALYEGEKWKNELEAIAMPMLDRYVVVLADVPEWFVNDIPMTHDEVRWE
jgi:hypothetical protein